MTVRILVCMVCLAWPLTAAAQVAPTDQQITLLEAGLDAHRAEQYEVAEAQFRAALEIANANVLRLNLARALQKQGRCREAEDEYLAALAAPRFVSPPADEVDRTIERYRAELRESCPGTITVQCSGASVTLTFAGRALECDVPRAMPPGVYRLATRGDGAQREVEVEIRALEDIVVELRRVERWALSQVEVPDAPAGSGVSLRQGGWTLVCAGGAAVATGGVFTLLTRSANDDIEDLRDGFGDDPSNAATAHRLIDTAETRETIQFWMYGAGAALVGTGVILIVLDDDDGPSYSIAPVLGPGELGLVWEVRH